MAAFEVLSLDPAVPQIRAPGAGDTYSVPREMAISVNTATDALRITQTGAGNALLVEDSANPDSSPFVVTAAGDVGIGTTAPAVTLDVVGLYIQNGNSRTNATTKTGSYRVPHRNNATNPMNVIAGLSSASLNEVYIGGNDTNFAGVAATNIRFFTAANNSTESGTERMRLDGSGRLGLNTTPGTGSGLFSLAYTSASLYSTAGAHPGAADTAFCGTYAINPSATTGAFASNLLYVRNGASVYQSAGMSAVSVAGVGSGYSPNLNFWAQDGASTFATRMTIDASGNLGLGVTPSAWSLGKAIEVGNLGNALWGIGSSNVVLGANIYYGSGALKYANTAAASFYQQSAGIHYWFNATSGTAGNTITFTQALTLNANGALVLQGGDTTANGVGVTFPATQSASSNANTLDDYEEGAWTPTVEGSTSPGTGGYTTQIGRYTRIGRVVTCQAYIAWTSHTGTGNLYLTGLPFTLDPTTDNHPSATIGLLQNVALTAGNIATAYGAPNSTRFNLIQYPTGGGAITFVPMDTAGEIIYSATYITAT